MSTHDAEIRAAIYRVIRSSGRVPTIEQIARTLDVETGAVTPAVRRLAAGHALALTPEADEIAMAHPFSSTPTAYTVLTPERDYWANCAWDALAIPSMFGADARMEARCACCGAAMRLTFTAGALQEDAGVVHFAVPPRRFWDDIGFT